MGMLTVVALEGNSARAGGADVLDAAAALSASTIAWPVTSAFGQCCSVEACDVGSGSSRPTPCDGRGSGFVGATRATPAAVALQGQHLRRLCPL